MKRLLYTFTCLTSLIFLTWPSITLGNNHPIEGSLTIPVVFHIIGDIEVDPMKFQEEIDNLNQVFSSSKQLQSGIRAQDPNLIGKSLITFSLATVDPNGNPFPGYTKSLPDQDISFRIIPVDKIQKADKLKQKGTGHPGWDRNRYINVWVSKAKDLARALMGKDPYIGYSYTPDIIKQYNLSEWRDGIVIDHNYLGKGKTFFAHEVGHYFNLYHPWEEDHCYDTPEVTFKQAHEPGGLLEINVMTYNTDTRVAFSKNQVERIEHTLIPSGYRHQLYLNHFRPAKKENTIRSNKPNIPSSINCQDLPITENQQVVRGNLKIQPPNIPGENFQDISLNLDIAARKDLNSVGMVVEIRTKVLKDLGFSGRIAFRTASKKNISFPMLNTRSKNSMEGTGAKSTIFKRMKGQLVFSKEQYDKLLDGPITEIAFGTFSGELSIQLSREESELLQKYLHCVPRKLENFENIKWEISKSTGPRKLANPNWQEIASSYPSQLYITDNFWLQGTAIAPGQKVAKVFCSPDGNKLGYETGNDRIRTGMLVLNPRYMKRLYMNLNESHSFADFSPDSEKMLFTKKNTYFIYNFENESFIELQEQGSGQYWFWIDNQTIMFKISTSAYSLNIVTKESKNYSRSEAEKMKRDLEFKRKKHPVFKYEYDRLVNKTSIVAYNRNKSYGKVLQRKVYLRQLLDFGQPDYFVIQKSDGRYEIVKIGLTELPPQSFTFKVDNLNSKDKALYLRSLKNNLPMYGIISGAKTNPYNNTPMGSNGVRLMRFRVLRGNEKEASGLVIFQYSPEASLEGSIVQRLSFTRKMEHPNYSYDKNAKPTIEYRITGETAYEFWSLVEKYRYQEQVLTALSNNGADQSPPPQQTQSTSAPNVSPDPPKSGKIISTNAIVTKYADGSHLGSSVQFNLISINTSCESCKKFSNEIKAIEAGMKKVLSSSPRWSQQNNVSSPQQVFMTITIQEFKYEENETEDNEGKKSKNYRARCNFIYEIKNTKGQLLGKGTHSTISGQIHLFKKTKQETLQANVESLERIFQKIIYVNLPLVGTIGEVIESNKKGIAKVLSISTVPYFPNSKTIKFSIFKKEDYQNSQNKLNLKKLGSCKLDLPNENIQAPCRVSGGAKAITDALKAKTELIVISEQ